MNKADFIGKSSFQRSKPIRGNNKFSGSEKQFIGRKPVKTPINKGGKA
ncbi:hypothetical protein MUO79_03645 [Candidatus Bathyarchaeota archaeon]|jgi:hypothetical protein|nr:hypothetical protein [Candidatus Bathyarchaeota archaeon]